jgi:predicted RNA-binding Zn-ribbon protein involved in translation (DUF1610 family)
MTDHQVGAYTGSSSPDVGIDAAAHADIEFEVKYEAGHSYRERWTRTAYFCPGCGEPGIWTEAGAGDYYVGSRHLCIKCGAAFYIPDEPAPRNDWQTRQRIDAITLMRRGSIADNSKAS